MKKIARMLVFTFLCAFSVYGVENAQNVLKIRCAKYLKSNETFSCTVNKPAQKTVEDFIRRVKSDSWGVKLPGNLFIRTIPFSMNLDQVDREAKKIADTMPSCPDCTYQLFVHRCLPIVAELNLPDESLDNKGYFQRKMHPDLEKFCQILQFRLEELLKNNDKKTYQFFVQPTVSFQDVEASGISNEILATLGIIAEKDGVVSISFKKADNVGPFSDEKLPNKIPGGAIIVPFRSGLGESTQNSKQEINQLWTEFSDAREQSVTVSSANDQRDPNSTAASSKESGVGD